MTGNITTRAFAWLRRSPLWAVLLLGLLLRLIGAESRSLQYDDVFSIFLSARSLPDIVSGTAADTMPPLYYFLLHFWLLLSREVWFIRLLTVLLSLTSVILLYALVRRLLGRSPALWASFLAAVSPLQIYHAQDIRMYALLVVGQLGYFLFFTRLYFLSTGESRRGSDWLGLVVFGLVAMYSHNLAIFALIVPNLFVLLKRDGRFLLRLLAAQACIGLLALPWLILIPGQIAKVQRAWWLQRPGLIEILQAIVMFTASLPLPLILLVICSILSLQVFIMVLLEAWRARQAQSTVHAQSSLLFLACWLFLPPVLLFAISYVMRPVFVPRGFLVSSLGFYALAGFVINHTLRRGVGPLTLGVFVLSVALSLPSFYTFNDFPRSPYREAAAYLTSIIQPDTLIVHDTKLSYFSSRFYAPGLPQVFVADLPNTPNDTFEPASQKAMQIFAQPDLPTAVGDSRDVYFVLFAQTFSEYQSMGLAQHPAITWLAQHFHQVDKQAFHDLEIYHYQR